MGAQESEDPVRERGQCLMREIRIDDEVLRRSDLVVCGELSRRSADGVHQPDRHQYAGLDPGSQVLNVYVAKGGEDLVAALVSGIEPTEELPQLGVGFDIEVHLPGALVITEEWVHGRGQLHP